MLQVCRASPSSGQDVTLEVATGLTTVFASLISGAFLLGIAQETVIKLRLLQNFGVCLCFSTGPTKPSSTLTRTFSLQNDSLISTLQLKPFKTHHKASEMLLQLLSPVLRLLEEEQPSSRSSRCSFNSAVRGSGRKHPR